MTNKINDKMCIEISAKRKKLRNMTIELFFYSFIISPFIISAISKATAIYIPITTGIAACMLITPAIAIILIIIRVAMVLKISIFEIDEINKMEKQKLFIEKLIKQGETK